VPAGWPTAAAKRSGTVVAADESEITIDEVGLRRHSTARWEVASGRSRRRWQTSPRESRAGLSCRAVDL
jgi:hypothetical protein